MISWVWTPNAWDRSTPEAEAERPSVQDEPGLYDEARVAEDTESDLVQEQKAKQERWRRANQGEVGQESTRRAGHRE